MSPAAPARHDFPTGTALAPAFAQWTAQRLRQAIEARGAALLVVSGGATPLRYFHALSSQPIDWSRVAITLADERRVADGDPRSNARLVRSALLADRAASAQFSPLADLRLAEELELAAANARIAALPSPADLVVLGMGEDGHTASWFPGAEGLGGGDRPRRARAGGADPRRRRPRGAPDADRPRHPARARDRAAHRGRGQGPHPGARPGRGPRRGDADPRRAAAGGGASDDLLRCVFLRRPKRKTPDRFGVGGFEGLVAGAGFEPAAFRL